MSDENLDYAIRRMQNFIGEADTTAKRDMDTVVEWIEACRTHGEYESGRSDALVKLESGLERLADAVELFGTALNERAS